MKKQIKSAFVLLFAAVVVAGSQLAASAQTPQQLTVDVPFDFVAGDKQLPAGRYLVRRVRFEAASALLIESAETGARVIVLTNAAGTATKRPTLTFNQYGEQHFLASVHLPGAGGGRELQESKQERDLRTAASAGRRAEPKTIALVGRQ